MSIAARPADHIRPPRWPGILAWSVAGATVLSLVPSVWLLLGVGCAVAANVFIEPYVLYGVLTRPGSLPGARLLLPFLYSTFFIALSCASFVLLLTPTGSLPSPRWRWWARVTAAAPALIVVGFGVQPDPLAPYHHGNPMAVPALAPALLAAALAGMALELLGLLAGAGSLVLRFRRARGSERLQLPWLALAAACASVLLPGLPALPSDGKAGPMTASAPSHR